MKMAGLLVSACLCVLIGFSSAMGGELPSLKDLVKKKETTEGKKEEEVEQIPRDLEIKEANFEAQFLLPPGPLCYMEAPNGKGLSDSLARTNLAMLLDEKKVKAFFRENAIGINDLFTDLPPSYASKAGVRLLVAAKQFATAFVNNPGPVVLAVYKEPGRGINAVLLADIGRHREKPFRVLEKVRDTFLDQYPNFVVQETPHGDDFVDMIQSDDGSSELAYGIIRNFAVVSTNRRFAKQILRYATKGKEGDALAQSSAYTDLGTYTDGKAQVRGFIDLPAIQKELQSNALPKAAEMMDLSCDVLGRGTKDAQNQPAMAYYDMRAEGIRIIEHVVSPTAAETAGFAARLQAVCKPADALGEAGNDWISPRLIPYQPDFFVASHLLPSSLKAFLELKEKHFGGSERAKELSAAIPTSLKFILKEAIADKSDELLTGEVALALLPLRGEETKRDWIIVMGVRDATAASSQFGDANTELGGVKIWTRDAEWKTGQCWGVFDQAQYKHIKSVGRGLPSSCLVVASSGALFQELVDQVSALTSLADNKDFLAQMKEVGRDNSLIWYLNLPGTVGREYMGILKHLRGFFPRLKSISNLPTMTMINKSTFGIAGGAQVREGQPYVRSTLTSPAPVIPSIAGLMGLHFPRWVRDRSRTQQLASRRKISRIWLALQTYATARGHFPESMQDLQNLFKAGEDRENLFTLEAARDYLGADAKLNSFRYLPGLRATDEPDFPILYEADAWHWDYADMIGKLEEEGTETGPYQRYRLVLKLSGKIETYTEKEFKKRVMNRIRSRE